MFDSYLLESYYKKWLEYIKSQDKKEFHSFGQSPFLKHEESYKKDIYTIGRELLDIDEWSIGDIGTGKILARVIESIEFKTVKEIVANNLVFTSSHSYATNASPIKTFHEMLENKKTLECEQILYSFYKNEVSDQKSFESLIELLGKKYSVITYLVFLKNDRRYLPLAPTRFQNNLNLIGSPLKLAFNCDWENYMDFMNIMMEIRDFLSLHLGGEDVHLLDAHSFVWELDLIDLTPEQLIPTATYVMVDSDYAHVPFQYKDKTSSITPEQIDISNLKKKEKGAEAESAAYNYEKDQLSKRVLKPSEGQFKQLSKNNAGLGYDIISLTEKGENKYIEVKTAHKSGNILRFFLTFNELNKSLSLPNYYFYIVVFGKNIPEIYILKSPFTSKSIERFEQIQPDNNIVIQPHNLIVSVPVKSVIKADHN